jgi:hypothetical protein
MFGRGNDRRRSAADALRTLMFGDAASDEWRPRDDQPASSEPWLSFAEASTCAQSGDAEGAARAWRRVTSMEGIEARHVLQAWHFLRGVGIEPSADHSSEVLGVVAEVATENGHDLLAAYRDGSVRYLNVSGKVLVVEPGASDPQTDDAVRHWIGVGQGLARVVGVWDQPELPPLSKGDSRMMMLTPGGHRFGQGPAQALRQDPAAATFFDAATRVLVKVTTLSGL